MLKFASKHSDDHRRRLSSVSSAKRPNAIFYHSLTPMWAGIACQLNAEKGEITIGISTHDSVYSTDFSSAIVKREPTAIEEHVLTALRSFSQEHVAKFLGAGIALNLLAESKGLCRALWLQMDIVPFVFNIKENSEYRPNIKRGITGLLTGFQTPSPAKQAPKQEKENNLAVPGSDTMKATTLIETRNLDEMADSAARKCLSYYGPGNNPRLSIESRNQVAVDCSGTVQMVTVEDFEKTVGQGTWNAVMKLAEELRSKQIKIGFFSSTPQGGGVALMRHALIRFLTSLEIDAAWYVPNPSPAVFRITKNNHNILQGVADPSLRLTAENKTMFDEWIKKNGSRWLAPGGPLADGGVDIAFIDDPQMPGLIPMIRAARPGLPIIYRSHIEIRSDLCSVAGSPQEEVWQYLWNNIKLADMFIAHPVSKFVPRDVPNEKLALLGAATDWLDGLNKPLGSWDSQYYMGEFRTLCVREKLQELRWPVREYFVQVARFDPAKGIPFVIDAYARFRKLLEDSGDVEDDTDMPQLLLCGHGAVDDPDASIIYDQVMKLLESEYPKIMHDIVVARLPPSDQLLNALLSNAKIALQLSTREGFEVKVSEAIHDGKPVVAFRTGGIPLQIVDGKSGYLVEPGDTATVAKHLFELYTDSELYKEMSNYAKTHVSDEVSTVGNAAAWMYLAVMYAARHEKLKPNGAWLNDMMRAETNEPYLEGEPMLPRAGLNMKG